MVTNFENNLISPGYLLNFMKVTKFERVIAKALRVIAVIGAILIGFFAHFPSYRLPYVA